MLPNGSKPCVKPGIEHGPARRRTARRRTEMAVTVASTRTIAAVVANAAQRPEPMAAAPLTVTLCAVTNGAPHRLKGHAHICAALRVAAFG